MIQFFYLIIMAMTGIPQQLLPYRQLLIFGSDKHSTLAGQQIKLLKDAKEAVDQRDLKTTTVKEKDILYKKYGVKHDEFKVILVGKDGTEKYRAKKVVPLAELFAIIDAMPMRRAEMKKNER